MKTQLKTFTIVTSAKKYVHYCYIEAYSDRISLGLRPNSSKKSRAK